MKAILGQKYGATVSYPADTREWTRIQRSELHGVYAADQESDGEDEMMEADGPATNQTPTEHMGHIRAMESAINNDAFLGKTKFSQEKYLRKKHEKFAKEVTILKPTIGDFCDSHTTEIRADMLGSLLRFAGSRQGTSVALVDDANGIITAALLQRQSIVDRYIFGKRSGQERAMHMFGVEKSESLRVLRDEFPEDRYYDSIIIAHNGTSEFDIAPMFEKLEPRLKLGGTIAIYARNIEPLLSLLFKLRCPEEDSEFRYLNVQMTEQMCREQEIIQDRTHPIMNQSIHLFQGFILSAIKVVS